MRSLLIGLVLATLGSVAAAQDETPVVRLSILPSVRGPADQFDGGDDRTGQTTVLAALTYTGTEPVEGCWISDTSQVYPSPSNPPIIPIADVLIDHREIDSDGGFIADQGAEFPMTPGQTRFFVLELSNSVCTARSCIARPRLNCADPGGAEGRRNAQQLNSRGLMIEQMQFNVWPAPMADIVPVMVTPTGDGFLRLPQPGGVAAAAVAAVNIGESRDITVVATSSGGTAADVCETDSSGLCLGPRRNTISVRMDRDAAHLFSVRVRDVGSYSLPRAPAHQRLFLHFIEERRDDHSLEWALVGDASAAIDEPAAAEPAPANLTGIWRFNRCLNLGRAPDRPRPGDATYGDRLLIGSNRMALAIARGLHGDDLCSSQSPVRLFRLQSIDLPGEDGVSGQRLASAATDYTGVWSTGGTSGSPAPVTITSPDGGQSLSFAGGILTFTSDPDDAGEAHPVAVRDFNTAFVPPPAGTFRLDYVMNGSPLDLTVTISETLALTTSATTGCELTGQLTPETGPAGASGLYRVTFSARNCPPPIVNMNGSYEGLILVEQSETGLVLGGGGLRETPFDGNFFFLLQADQVAE